MKPVVPEQFVPFLRGNGFTLQRSSSPFMGSKRDNRRVCVCLLFLVSWGRRGFQSVHFAHLNVHEHEVEGVLLERASVRTALGRI
jgi:hypothetical protein